MKQWELFGKLSPACADVFGLSLFQKGVWDPWSLATREVGSATVAHGESQILMRCCCSVAGVIRGPSLPCHEPAKAGSPSWGGCRLSPNPGWGCFGQGTAQDPLSLCKPTCTSSNLTPRPLTEVTKMSPKENLKHRSHFLMGKGTQGLQRRMKPGVPCPTLTPYPCGTGLHLFHAITQFPVSSSLMLQVCTDFVSHC